jgi:hypothetical protein
VQFRRLVSYIALLAVFVMAVQPSTDTDTWWHLRAGAWMVEQGQLLDVDYFSLTRIGESWIYPGWLSQIGLYWIYAQWGFAGLNIFTGAMVLLAFTAIWLSMKSHPLLRAFALLLGAAASGVYWSARPQIITFAISGIWIYLLEGAKQGRHKRLWIMPVLMILWVNIHGGFAVGFILLGCYLMGGLFGIARSVLVDGNKLVGAWAANRQPVLRLLYISIGCLVAVNINPHGPAMLFYPFRTISIGPLQNYIAEWQSPNFHRPEFMPFMALLFLTFFCLALSKEARPASDFLLLAVFGCMGLIAVRNIALFALVSVPILARHADSIIRMLPLKRERSNELPQRLTRPVNLFLAALVTLAAMPRIAYQVSEDVNQQHLQDQLPLKAFAFIQNERPEGPLFNSYNWGGYILWALYPDYLSFVDGRTDLFGEELLDQYIRAWHAEPGWEQLLNQWDIHLVLIESNAPLAKVLMREGWMIRYQDEQAIILSPITDEI